VRFFTSKHQSTRATNLVHDQKTGDVAASSGHPGGFLQSRLFARAKIKKDTRGVLFFESFSPTQVGQLKSPSN
jgi:hypothetical protein